MVLRERRSKIGCFDPRAGAFREFALPAADRMPVGIAVGGDGNLWFTEKQGNRIGRITAGRNDHGVCSADRQAGPDGIVLGPDGNIWFSEGEADRIARGSPLTAASPNSARA